MNILFTSEGFNNLVNEIQELENSMPYLVSELKKASELGDRSENAAYRVAKSKLRQTSNRISYLNSLKNRSKVVAPSGTSKIEIGCRVSLEINGKDFEYKVVGSHEADPSKGYISYLSPIGKVILNKKVGESVELEINGFIKKITIKSIL
jgi:transcription elongation GreA/GreB family factor